MKRSGIIDVEAVQDEKTDFAENNCNVDTVTRLCI